MVGRDLIHRTELILFLHFNRGAQNLERGKLTSLCNLYIYPSLFVSVESLSLFLALPIVAMPRPLIVASISPHKLQWWYLGEHFEMEEQQRWYPGEDFEMEEQRRCGYALGMNHMVKYYWIERRN